MLYFLVSGLSCILEKEEIPFRQSLLCNLTTSSPWFTEKVLRPALLLSFNCFLCLYGPFVYSDVSGMVFQGEGEGQRGQGKAAEWTPVQHRLLLRPHRVRGV